MSRKSPAAGRALQVLEILGIDPQRRLSLAELRRSLGASQGTVHALLSTLERAGYVRRDPSDRLYSLGPAVLPIGDAARQAYPVVDRALGPMHELADELDTECHAGMRVSDEILIVARLGPVQPLGLGVQVGQRYPLTPPLGAAYMAWASPEDIHEYLMRAAPNLTPEELDRQRQSLAAVRTRGYSAHADDGPRQDMAELVARRDGDAESTGIDRTVRTLAQELGHYRYLLADDDLVPGSFLELSAPVFGPDGSVVLTVGVTSVTPKIAATPVEEVASRVMATAQAVTRSVGGRPPLTAAR